MKMTVKFTGDEDDLIAMLTRGVRVLEVTPLKTGYSVIFEDIRHDRAGRPSILSQEQLDEMYHLYRDGYSFTYIADKIGCSRQYVSRVVKARSRKMREDR